MFNTSKEEYFKVFMKIGMILRPGIEADDLQKIIREDFETDAQEIKKEIEIDPEDPDGEKKKEEAEEEQP